MFCLATHKAKSACPDVYAAVQEHDGKNFRLYINEQINVFISTDGLKSVPGMLSQKV